MIKQFVLLLCLSFIQAKCLARCDINRKCPSYAPCCNQSGHCGSSKDYCEAGCNPLGSHKPSYCNKPALTTLAAPLPQPTTLQPSLPSATPSSTHPSNPSCPGGFTSTFSNGLPSIFNYEGPVVAANGNMVIKFSRGDTPNPLTGIIQGYGGTAKTAQTFLYGKFTARMKTARIGGVVSAFILYSDQKDEIDWEWVGKNERESQTNFYGKGVTDYTKGVFIPNSFNTHAEFHDYGIAWTPESITWTIDGNVVRTVTKQSTLQKDGTYSYPDTASHLYFNVWDGGAGADGTRDWAGGQVNYNDPEYVQNGGYISAEVEWVKYECV